MSDIIDVGLRVCLTARWDVTSDIYDPLIVNLWIISEYCAIALSAPAAYCADRTVPLTGKAKPFSTSSNGG